MPTVTLLSCRLCTLASSVYDNWRSPWTHPTCTTSTEHHPPPHDKPNCYLARSPLIMESQSSLSASLYPSLTALQWPLSAPDTPVRMATTPQCGDARHCDHGVAARCHASALCARGSRRWEIPSSPSPLHECRLRDSASPAQHPRPAAKGLQLGAALGSALGAICQRPPPGVFPALGSVPASRGHLETARAPRPRL